jgi:hypothetical protein
MQTIFEANWYDFGRNYHRVDCDDESIARKLVEDNESGHVTTFVRGFDGRDRSCALHRFEDGRWVAVNIHE